MRRTFPRIPSSPQATPTVETPAHYAPTPLWSLALLFEVVNGNVRAQYVFCSEEQLQRYKKNPLSYHLYRKNCIILHI